MTMHHDGRKGTPLGDDYASVERQIAALGGAILPGRRHRDEVLEHTSDSVGRTRNQRRTVQVTLVMALLLVLGSPLISALTRVQPPRPQTADQTNAAALRHAEASQMSFDWALVDIFRQFRERKRAGGR
ncbi:hypothetical protein Mal15_66320 [Stieleria maiorica]|uniref:Uncharacterized protein n=1 Tax=Stieleria maiorica TaxID=2795974 RepID=A0A5B9MQK0_9BACT|nr:hypothetical protein [Stieleria maiorica]QEG02511.1 hypothetical protein Mal15_66320 [Stieleria maiorica]